MGVLPACMSVYHLHTISTETEEGAGSLDTEVIGFCEQSCGGWESNPGPLKQQPGLLTLEQFLASKCTFIH